MSSHPEVEILALFALRDLPWSLSLRTRRHVNRCAACEQQVLLFRSGQTELKRQAAAEVLSGYEAIADWQTLERDMLGNIAVGVDAGRCIEKTGPPRRYKTAWRFAWVSGMTLLFAAGWAVRIPTEETVRIFQVLRHAVGLDRQAQFAGAIVHSTPEGIAVNAQGSTLTIFNPRSAVVTMSSPSSVTARYVDDDSGQVTITNVYGQ